MFGGVQAMGEHTLFYKEAQAMDTQNNSFSYELNSGMMICWHLSRFLRAVIKTLQTLLALSWRNYRSALTGENTSTSQYKRITNKIQ